MELEDHVSDTALQVRTALYGYKKVEIEIGPWTQHWRLALPLPLHDVSVLTGILQWLG